MTSNTRKQYQFIAQDKGDTFYWDEHMRWTLDPSLAVTFTLGEGSGPDLRIHFIRASAVKNGLPKECVQVRWIA
jgi:hypothetical protein